MDTLKGNGVLHIQEHIFYTAIDLFVEFGYESVSVRDIATAAGVEVEAVYNCYASKKELLSSIYQFCIDMHRNAEPDLDELLRMAETASLSDITRKIGCRLNPANQVVYDKILLIAMHDFSFNTESAQLIEETLFCPVERNLTPVLNKLLDLGRIEPLDTSVFSSIFKNYCFASAVLNSSTFKIDSETKRQGYAMLFSLLKPVNT